MRGIGVAERVSTSTSLKSSLNFSLCRTPKRCSSSITTRPRSLKTTSPEMSRCVPTTTSTPPSRNCSSTFRCSAVRTEPAQHFDSHRIIEHALPKSFEMLLCQHRRRGENRDLFAFHHRFKGGANRNLGFAESNVAANQAIHRARRFHVGFVSAMAVELIGRFAKRKRMLELRAAIWCRLRRRGRAGSSRSACSASILPA